MDKMVKLVLWLLPLLVKRKIAVTLPVTLEDSPEWNDDDRKNLAAFLRGPTGSKLKDVLVHDMYSAAISGVKMTDFEQGVIAGKNRELGLILAHAQQDDTEA